MFACLYIPPLAGRPAAAAHPVQPGLWAAADAAADDERAARGDLVTLAREFSPRVEVHRPGLVTLDARGLGRLFGDAHSLGQELRRAAAERGLPARVALASTRTAAWLIAHTRAGLTVVAAGDERRWLAPLPLHVLEQLAANGLGPAVAPRSDGGQSPRVPPSLASDTGASFGVARRSPEGRGGRKSRLRSLEEDMRASAWRAEACRAEAAESPKVKAFAAQEEGAASVLAVLKRWGLKTLGEFADLPAVELSERLGQQGLAWQHVARGQEMVPLVPDVPEERFEETLDLEWPIEGLQPLSFVLGRLLDALSAHLAARDRAAAVLHVHLQLVTREVERRSLQLPAPMREARVLRTLALLNLESHPVGAGIDRVTVIADPVPSRVIQCSLLTRAVPFPEQLSTLLARLAAVMGEHRCGMAALVDSHRPGAFELQPFNVSVGAGAPGLKPRGPTPTRVTPNGVVPPGFSPGEPGPSPTPTRVGPAPTRVVLPGFSPGEPGPSGFSRGTPTCVIRRFRIPIAAAVAVAEDGRPQRVAINRAGLGGGLVDGCAGPWRTSGEWWRVADARVQSDGSAERALVGWNRDEWDVNLSDGAVYRLYRDRDRDRWFVDGIID